MAAVMLRVGTVYVCLYLHGYKLLFTTKFPMHGATYTWLIYDINVHNGYFFCVCVF